MSQRDTIYSESSGIPPKRTYAESAELIAAYFRQNGTLPVLDPELDDEQIRLAASLYTIRTLKKQGKIPDAVIKILDQACPGWTEGVKIGSDRRWRARAEELISWVTRHGRAPHHAAGDSTERALAAWVKLQRTHRIHGRHPERIKELDARLPDWSLTPTVAPGPPLDWITK